jgi:HEAT repeat protein
MYQVLIGAILAMLGVFVVLGLIIVGNKFWRDRRERRVRRHRLFLQPKLLAYITGAKATVRDALGKRPSGWQRRVLEVILLDISPSLHDDERTRATAAFEELGLIRRYLKGLASSAWWTRAENAERLGAAGSRQAIEPLSHALRDDSLEVRLRAARALADLGGPTALRPLIRALDEPSRWSAIRIAHILAEQGEGVVTELTTAYAELSPPARLAVIDILAEIHALEAAGWLRELLADAEPDVRARASSALGAIGDSASGAALTRVLHDRAWQARAMAAKSIGAIHHQPAIPNLAIGLRDDVWWVRTNCAEALLRMGDEGLQTLVRMLDDVDTYAAHQAVSVLEDAGLIDGWVDDLIAVNPDRRKAAESYVHRLVAVGQTDRLRALASGHQVAAIRERLAALLPPPEQPGAESAKEGVA